MQSAAAAAGAAGGPLVRISGLTVRYGTVTALDALEMTVPAGAVGLLGPNGAGKTTLIKVLLGHLTPPGGTVEVLGRDPRARRERMAIRRGVGYMPESESLLPGMSGLETVALLGRLSGLAREDALARAHEMLDYTGVEEERYRDAGGYSTGMKQRLKLAQALVHDPGFLLLDEPTNGLDPKARVHILELIRDLHARHGKSLLLCSHLLPDVERVCDDVVVLHRGRALRGGRIAELTAGTEDWVRVEAADGGAALAEALRAGGSECVAETGGRLRVRLDRRGDADAIFEVAEACGAVVAAVEPLRLSLEDVFLGLVGAPPEDRP